MRFDIIPMIGNILKKRNKFITIMITYLGNILNYRLLRLIPN